MHLRSSHHRDPIFLLMIAMNSTRLHLFFLLVMASVFTTRSSAQAGQANSKLFREYIGAENNGVRFADVPIHSGVEFHFILSFAIDYTTSFHPTPTDADFNFTESSHPTPTDSTFNFTAYSHPKATNGNFNVFWDTKNLSPSHVSAIKASHPNAKVAMSLGGDTVIGNHYAYFSPTSINSWVRNAIASIVQITREFKLDGIDIDYEHFQTDPNTFADCIGQLLYHLKQNNIVSFTSIAPYDNDSIQPYYLALWRKYGHLVDYVNFQFYAYSKHTTITQFMKHFETQSSNYKGGKILVSIGTDNSGGLSPKNGFFEVCATLKSQGKLHGIFIWSADDSKKASFRYEKQSQRLLAI